MSVLGDIASLGASFATGGGFGLLARGAMQVVGFFEKRQDDANALAVKKLEQEHELAMLTKNFEITQATAKGEIDKLVVQGDQALALEAAMAFTTAQDHAAQPTGIKAVDLLNGLMRPLGYFSLFGPYAVAKGLIGLGAFFVLFSALSPDVTFSDAAQWALDTITRGYTQFDMDLIGSMVGFVWADRTFANRTHTAAGK